MYKKEKGLAVGSENLAKIYLIEIKIVSLFQVARVMKNAGGEK